MMYADTAEGRVEAAPGLTGTCPSCGYPCRPKCGQLVIWHWAHHACADCDPWAEPMTEWHLGWQRAVPPERREVVMAPHRADIVTPSGGVVEIQHSPIPPGMIGEREAFYGDQMAWIFDATQADITVWPGPRYFSTRRAAARLSSAPGSGCGRGPRAGAGTKAAQAAWRRGSGRSLVRPGESGGRYVCELLVSLPVCSA